MLKDYFVTGIGTGTSAFREVYAAYALPGAEEAADSGSLFFEIGIEHGLFGVILFGLVLFFAARVSFSFLASPPLPEDRENRVRTCAGIAGITAFLVVGLQCYVWSDPRVFCLFWMTLALVPDIAVCAKRDRITHIPDDDLLPEE